MDIKVTKQNCLFKKNISFFFQKGVQEIFEKSVKTMDNIDFIENGINENIPSVNISPRLSNPSIPKQIKQGNISTKQNSTNKTCSIS